MWQANKPVENLNVQDHKQTIPRIYIWKIHRGSEYNLFTPRSNTEALEKILAYRGTVLWNSLSQEAKQA